MKVHSIKNAEQYKLYLEKANELISLDPDTGSEEANLLEVLALVIEDYEKKEFPLEIDTPLDAISFRMEQQGLQAKDLIPYLGDIKTVRQILDGKLPLTAEMIRELHYNLGIPAESLLLREEDKSKESEIEWNNFPYEIMKNRGWFKNIQVDSDNKIEVIKEFFKTIEDSNLVPTLFRGSLNLRTRKGIDAYSIMAWFARIIILGKKKTLASYKINDINDSFLSNLVKLSASEEGPLKAIEMLEKKGIAVVIEPALPKTYIDGCSTLLNNIKPIIGLTLRNDRLDNFWFTLIHEVVHIIKHIENDTDVYIDELEKYDDTNIKEKEADILTRNIFIPRKIWMRSKAYKMRTEEAINELASNLNIHPSIVAGRLRKETNNYQIFNDLIGQGKVKRLFEKNDS